MKDRMISLGCACGKCLRRIQVKAEAETIRFQAIVQGHTMVELRLLECQREQLIRLLQNGRGEGEPEHDLHCDLFRNP